MSQVAAALSDAATRHIPVILLSGLDDDQARTLEAAPAHDFQPAGGPRRVVRAAQGADRKAGGSESPV
jgi:hypothetical protein